MLAYSNYFFTTILFFLFSFIIFFFFFFITRRDGMPASNLNFLLFGSSLWADAAVTIAKEKVTGAGRKTRTTSSA